MTALSLSLNEVAWQYACDKSNVAAQAALPVTTPPTPFVPETWQAYAQRIITGVESSYLEQQTADSDAVISAATPDEKARIAKLLGQPQTVKDEFATQVDALPNAPT